MAASERDFYRSLADYLRTYWSNLVKFTMTIDAPLPKGQELALLMDWLDMVRSKVDDVPVDAGLTALELSGGFTLAGVEVGSFSLETELE